MAEEYELKQVKVRLKLAEAEPLYSTEQITTPDKAAEVMAQVLAQMDREYCCVVNLDGGNHPINFNVVSIGDVNQAHVPIQNVFKSAILSNASSIMMFHNHPSGSVQASREDIDVTKRLIEAGRIMNIPVLDHIIVGGGTAERFSFKEENPEMFNVSERAAYTVHDPGLGINVHTIGTEKSEDLQWDFLSGGRIDLDGLMYMPEMSQNEEVIEALHQLADKYPEAQIIGRFPDETQQETSEPDIREEKEQQQEMMSAEQLAMEIDQFAYETDTYEYKDTVDDREANIRGIAESIETGQDGGARAYLTSFVEESEDPETVAQAKELLKKLDEYKPLAKVEEMVEQNYNMIDNVINNLPQDPEEKKEPAPQKEMRTAEVKKVRKRVSMKSLLAEKKAEIAERDKKPPEVSAPSKRPSMGMDD